MSRQPTGVPRNLEGRTFFDVIDTHTEGEPTRVVVDGLPELRGSTLLERREMLRREYDWIRTSLLLEPRGHSDQFGALVVPPSSEEADFGLIFMDTGGYLDMCCHATIGAATALIESGAVKGEEPYTELRFETPAGLVAARARVRGGRVRQVSVVDVPSVYLGSARVSVGGKAIDVDIAYGGNLCVIATGEDLGLEVRRCSLRELVRAGMDLRKAANQARDLWQSQASSIDLAMITGEPELEGSHGKNIVIFGDGQFDRSPCGTGTAARLAAMHARGEIGEGEWFVHESILNTTFRARIVDVMEVRGRRAIVPEITGRAFVTQRARVVIDPEDPFWMGFRA
jgi:proline racemase